MSDVLIQAENLGKKFCRRLRRSLWYGALDIGSDLIGSNGSKTHLRKEEFWALNKVSFNLRRGECLGLIGRNGSGKTTLLKIINNLMKLDYGRLQVRGRVGALIALGAGFNPLLTGRENVYVNGAVLGLTKKDVDNGMEEILDFAGIGEFIDAPVQSYSSGMAVRLGFAIATRFSPNVILLDEVLAVGDFGFQSKCLARINELKRSGVASILVSHNMAHITQYADRCLWLEKGFVHDVGETKEMSRAYLQFSQEQESIKENNKQDGWKYAFGPVVEEHPQISQLHVSLTDLDGQPTKKLSSIDPFIIQYSFETTNPRPVNLTFRFYKKDGTLLATINNELDEFQVQAKGKLVEGRVRIENFSVLPGDYVLVAVVQDGPEYLHRRPMVRFQVTSRNQESDLFRHGIVHVPHQWI
ncbi:MAG: ABC transporter ATP-binding protein [Opitutae bacterium]|nr:ABC transporter ATP-binding protein [Opitutae bacterium]|tara:strand:+ start:2187 stop:3425 length:1239 start_codon:yes stop_codon:yes gene_type:complete